MAGFNVDVKTEHGEPLLHVAVRYGCIEICNLLLKNGANLNATNDFRDTALIVAAGKTNVEICKLLIAFKASITSVSTEGRTALMEAARMKSYEVVKLLLEKGSNIGKKDEDGNTALHHAIPCSNQLLQLLLDNNADIDAVNNNGWTPLMLACDRANAENALILAQKGAVFEIDGVSAWGYAADNVSEHLRRYGYTRLNCNK